MQAVVYEFVVLVKPLSYRLSYLVSRSKGGLFQSQLVLLSYLLLQWV